MTHLVPWGSSSAGQGTKQRQNMVYRQRSSCPCDKRNRNIGNYPSNYSSNSMTAEVEVASM